MDATSSPLFAAGCAMIGLATAYRVHLAAHAGAGKYRLNRWQRKGKQQQRQYELP